MAAALRHRPHVLGLVAVVALHVEAQAAVPDPGIRGMDRLVSAVTPRRLERLGCLLHSVLRCRPRL